LGGGTQIPLILGKGGGQKEKKGGGQKEKKRMHVARGIGVDALLVC